MLDEEQFIYRIGKLSLGPNDILVVQTDLMLDKDQVAAVRDRIQDFCERVGIGNRYLVLTHGMHLNAIEYTPEVERALEQQEGSVP